jgi:hypothetical protein
MVNEGERKGLWKFKVNEPSVVNELHKSSEANIKKDITETNNQKESNNE